MKRDTVKNFAINLIILELKVESIQELFLHFCTEIRIFVFFI